MTNGNISVSGVIPMTGDGMSVYRSYCEESGFALMSMAAHLAISHLAVIEYGTLNVQVINSGISYLPYMMSTSEWSISQNSGISNTVVLPYESRSALLNVGDTVYLTDEAAHDTSDPRTITSITVDKDNRISITYDGSPYSLTAGTSRCFPAMQRGGRTDVMEYCNGRIDSSTMNSPFLYRGIENPWGNVWELVDCVSWNKSSGKYTVNGVETSFTAPYQPNTGNDKNTDGFIQSFGYDPKLPWATLPETVGKNTSTSHSFPPNMVITYIPDEWTNASSSEDSEQIFAVSGGWDHQSSNGAFNIRTSTSDLAVWLFGYRAMIP